MANKNQLERYMLIDAMLTHKYRKYPTRQEIISQCKAATGFDYSQSAFEKDLRVMRSRYNAPITYNPKKGGYCYEDASYRFLKVDISRNDKILLDLTRALLGAEISNAFLPFFEEVENTLQVTTQLEEDHSLLKVVQLDRIGCLNISEVLALCIKALKEEKQLQFTYSKFAGEKSEQRTMHPYLLKEFKGRWFITGWCTAARAIRTFGLDRMSQTALLERKVVPADAKGFNRESYYSHVYGITNDNGQPEGILLHFTPLQAKYVKTQPLHSSQQIVSEDKKGGTLIRLYLIPNRDLIIQLLSYGPDMEVIQPESVREQVQALLEQALRQYRQAH